MKGAFNVAKDEKKDEKQATGLDEFLHPKAMLTPGIAGGLTTLITNVLTTQFSLLPNYTGLIVSCLFGLIVFRTTAIIPGWHKAVYFCLNSLVIFSVAMGANQAGVRLAEAQPRSQPPSKVSEASLRSPFFSNWIDGTVSKRAELLSKLPNVDEAQAKEALNVLNLGFPKSNSPTQALTWYTASARTAGDIEAINLALVETRTR